MIPSMMNCISALTARVVSTTMIGTEGEDVTMTRRPVDNEINVTEEEGSTYENENENKHVFD